MSYIFKVDLKALSCNQLHRCCNGRIIKSAKYRQWLTECKESLSLQIKTNSEFPLTSNIKITLHFYFKDKRKRDIDNCIKSLFDALNNIIIKDDSQIQSLLAIKDKDIRDHIELTIETI